MYYLYLFLRERFELARQFENTFIQGFPTIFKGIFNKKNPVHKTLEYNSVDGTPLWYDRKLGVGVRFFWVKFG